MNDLHTLSHGAATNSIAAQRGQNATNYGTAAQVQELIETFLASVLRRIEQSNHGLVAIRDRLVSSIEVAQGPIPTKGERGLDEQQPSGRVHQLLRAQPEQESLLIQIAELAGAFEAIM